MYTYLWSEPLFVNFLLLLNFKYYSLNKENPIMMLLKLLHLNKTIYLKSLENFHDSPVIKYCIL